MKAGGTVIMVSISITRLLQDEWGRTLPFYCPTTIIFRMPNFCHGMVPRHSAVEAEEDKVYSLPTNLLANKKKPACPITSNHHAHVATEA